MKGDESLKNDIKHVSEYDAILAQVDSIYEAYQIGLDEVFAMTYKQISKCNEKELIDLNSEYTHHLEVCARVLDYVSLVKSNLKYNPIFTGVFDNKAKEFNQLENYTEFFLAMKLVYENRNKSVFDALSYQRHLRYIDG